MKMDTLAVGIAGVTYCFIAMAEAVQNYKWRRRSVRVSSHGYCSVLFVAPIGKGKGKRGFV